MESVSDVFTQAVDSLNKVGLSRYAEPIEHVLEVERLRQAYRPDGEIAFLLIAESHVRVGSARFRGNGAGFIYEHRYYTPWWHQLLLPAFGVAQRSTPVNRLQWLQYLKSSGFWLLDASLLSLSGYQKVDDSWPRRPFDELRDQLLGDSWNARVGIVFERIMNQRRPPVLCVFKAISSILPEEARKCAAIINFSGPGNARKYFDPSYEYGTARFCEAARQAGIEGCFSRLGLTISSPATRDESTGVSSIAPLSRVPGARARAGRSESFHR